MSRTEVPPLSTDQMREVDRLMIEEYGIALIQMMENAGRNLATLTKRLLDGEIQDRTVVVLAGRGNNGGGGLVAARHLSNWGAWVQVLCTHPQAEYHGIPAHQLAILQQMEVPLIWAEEGWAKSFTGTRFFRKPKPWIRKTSLFLQPDLWQDLPAWPDLGGRSAVNHRPRIRNIFPMPI